MIENKEDGKKAFYVSCANWECMVKTTDEADAAAIAVEMSNKKFGKELNLAPNITVLDISSILEKMEVVDDCYMLYTPDVLANAGMYDLSSKYNKIINLMKKENEN
jgi:hypothetical protein